MPQHSAAAGTLPLLKSIHAHLSHLYTEIVDVARRRVNEHLRILCRLTWFAIDTRE